VKGEGCSWDGVQERRICLLGRLCLLGLRAQGGNGSGSLSCSLWSMKVRECLPFAWIWPLSVLICASGGSPSRSVNLPRGIWNMLCVRGMALTGALPPAHHRKGGGGSHARAHRNTPEAELRLLRDLPRNL